MTKVLTALLVMAVLGSCNFILGPDKPAAGNGEGGTGNLVISIGGADREIAPGSGIPLPDDVLAVLRYELTLTGPGGSTLTAAVSPGQNLSMTVMVGGWRIDARAYQENILAGTGSLNFTVSAGVNAVRVPMNMSGSCYEITVSNDTVHGTVRSNFTAAFPGTAITITAENDGDAFFMDNTLRAWTDTIPVVVDGPGTSHSFTMPAEDVAVYADFRQFARYVREGGAGYGTSWEDASSDIQTLMDELETVTIPGYTGPYIVKLGAGTYIPQYKPEASPGPYAYDVTGDARDRAFILREGVQVWGGYPASGGDSRDIAANETILSGDLNGDDASNSIGDNAYHVVLGVNIPAASGTVLDGLTISGGNATGTSSFYVGTSITQQYGGGMFNRNSSPVLINVTISGNKANAAGGMYNSNSSPVLINAAISGNTAATGAGGGMRNDGSSPVLINTTISGNTAADQGGGMYGSSLALINVLISGNTAATYGGGMHNTGSPSPTLINVTIAGNTAVAYDGGGIANSSSNPVIRNSIIWGNTGGANPSIYNLGSTPSIEYSMVEGYSGGTGNQTAPSPVDTTRSPFADWKDPAVAPTTEGIYSLNNTINAADAKNSGFNTSYPTSADNAVFPVGLSAEAKAAIDAVLGKDLGGNSRVQGAAIDMGAYERE